MHTHATREIDSTFAARPRLAAVPERFGDLVGRSAAMRRAFAHLALVARSDATVLVEGETGCGKGKAAEAIHRASARRDRPFVVVDCGAIPAPLLESELFGHEKGAFTGAHARHVGAFEAADGGTVFLDEIGELPSELQPKLLRALESREIRRVGSTTPRRLDLRVIAATHRDLRAGVAAGRFREDLYYRLAVVTVRMPALRECREDIPVVARALLEGMGVDDNVIQSVLTPAALAEIASAPWPGNARQLRNHLERCLVFRDDPPPCAPAAPAREKARRAFDRVEGGSYAEARARAIEDFERHYVTALLEANGGNISLAASACGVSRVYLHRLLRKHRVT